MSDHDPLVVATGLIFVVPFAVALFAFVVARAKMKANSDYIGAKSLLIRLKK